MAREPTLVYSENANQSTASAVHALMQFLVAVRYRKHVVMTALVVAGLLAGLYYTTATRYYRSSVSVLVMQTGPDSISPTVVGEGGRQALLMRTFEELFTATDVTRGALQYLKPEDCIDFSGAPRESWPDIIRAGLSTSIVQGAKIIEVTYRSKDPRAAVAVVNAVVASYRDYLSKTHRGSAGEMIRILGKEKVELAEELQQTQQKILETRQRIGDLGFRSDSKVLHPMVQRVQSFNEALIAARTQRVELDASLAAILTAVRNGEDLRQHILTVADAVGRELLLKSLGFDQADAYVQAELHRRLLEDDAVLRTMQRDLGPAHPEVIAKLNLIHSTKEYLRNYQQRIDRQLAEMQNTQLGPMLVQMVRQKQNEVRQRELSLQAQFDQAQAEANNLSVELTQLENLELHVEWLQKMRQVMLDSIAKVKLRGNGQEVRTAVVHPAVQATRPCSPDLRRVIILALVAGLAGGLGLVYVLDILDDRFRCVEELQTQLNVPVLAMVRQLKPTGSTGPEALQVHVAPNSTESEAFRTLRTALALTDNEARQIVISSAEPGDGKTTVLTNLAVSYAHSEKRTLLIDADLRRPGMTAMMAMRGVEGLSGIIRGDGDVVEMATACIRASGIEGLDVLASGPRPTNPAEVLAHPRFSELLSWAESVYDQILIDSPPCLATSDAAVIGRLVDGLVMVVQPDKNRRRLVIRATESLAGLKIPLLGVVVNRIGDDNGQGYYGYGTGYGYGYAPDYGADEDGPQPHRRDDDAEEQADHETAAPDSPAGEAPNRLARPVPRRAA